MDVHLITQLTELEPLADDWRRLAQGNPFLGPEWLIPWWRHLGSVQRGRNRSLSVLAVFDAGGLAGLVPWYCEQTRLHGRVLRLLGSGSVCSDYLSIPCREDLRSEAIVAIADWLCRQQDQVEGGWDLVELECIDPQDPQLALLLSELETRGVLIHTRRVANCWRLTLPDSWEQYVATLSKTNRKRARRLDRNYLQTGRAKLHFASNPAELAEVYTILVDLHTRRWQSRGEPGIFAEPGILEFHREASERLLSTGQLWMNWLEIDGAPAAAEYCLSDGKILYSYQSGLNPDLILHEPGTIALVDTLQLAIQQGLQGLDFLRGDEPYKLDWRATPQPMYDVRLLPGNLQGHLRQSLWQATVSAKDLFRAGRDALLSAR
jgi:CelD/BcsL family acetyltransferase involved in cellulose biosynthesis